MELGGRDKLGGLQGWRGPVSCSLSERNVRGMGRPWVTTCCMTKCPYATLSLSSSRKIANLLLVLHGPETNGEETRTDANLPPIRYQSGPGILLASLWRTEISIWQHAGCPVAGSLVAVTQCPKRDILLGLGQRTRAQQTRASAIRVYDKVKESGAPDPGRRRRVCVYCYCNLYIKYNNYYYYHYYYYNNYYYYYYYYYYNYYNNYYYYYYNYYNYNYYYYYNNNYYYYYYHYYYYYYYYHNYYYNYYYYYYYYYYYHYYYNYYYYYNNYYYYYYYNN
ncbi:hypothetical protein EYF80_001849 [Liparis tanakae]|uniref:Uncharacterized protein n=1 Tax=Liparis tanakae TaxID=230148 RepID=A0A4Z2JC40_9TELE|nr:hypothetical protein EYF80_001849 [Liparis tanakae]